MVQTARRTTGVPQLLNTVAHVPVVQVELESGAVVKETAEISQLLLLRNRWLPVVLAALRGEMG